MKVVAMKAGRIIVAGNCETRSVFLRGVVAREATLPDGPIDDFELLAEWIELDAVPLDLRAHWFTGSVLYALVGLGQRMED